jgi:hypothetical protein
MSSSNDKRARASAQSWFGRGRLRLVLLLVPTLAAFAALSSAPASAATWSLTLVASSSVEPTGSPVTLTATANQDLSICGTTTCYIDIFETGNGNWWGGSCCSGSQGQAFAAESTSGTYCFVAYVDTDPTVDYPPTGVLATSNTVCVQWIRPSDSCTAPGTVTVANGQIEGFDTKLQEQQIGSQTTVCVRVDGGSGSSLAVGGALVINDPVPQPILGGVCAASPGNIVPGGHPIISENFLGQQVVLDVYADGSTTAWACLQVGTVSERVGVSGVAVSAQWDPDPDSLASLLGRGLGLPVGAPVPLGPKRFQCSAQVCQPPNPLA